MAVKIVPYYSYYNAIFAQTHYFYINEAIIFMPFRKAFVCGDFVWIIEGF